MQLETFKIRASSVSQIMTNSRSKSETLSETCKTYLETWVKEKVYNTQKTIKSKYLTKGIEVEEIAIEYYADVKRLGFVLPNQDHFSNDFMTGKPDLIHDSLVYEFKSSWDCFTFPLFESEPNKANWMQLQIYLYLTGLEKGKLVYTLQNTPDELVWDEAADYSDIAPNFRIKEFDVDIDFEFIKSVENRVVECREYVSQLISKIK